MADSIDITMPDSEGTESVVAGWLKKAGDRVRAHEPLAEIATDKVTVEVSAPADGVLAEIVKDVDASVEPGDVIGRIDIGSGSNGESGSGEPARPHPGEVGGPGAGGVSASAPPSPGNVASGSMADRLSPAVRRLVRRNALDVSAIAGTGRGGRVTVADVEAFVASGGASASTGPAPAGRHTYRAPEADTRIPHTPMRKRIAEHMVHSMTTAPHVTAIMDADLHRVIAHRRVHEDPFAAEGVRLTLTAYFVMAAVDALRTVPEVNSRWHDDAVELLADCNIGIATAVDAGLIVPVIRRAQRLDLLGVARALTDITDRGRAGRLNLDEVRGGTFTITNHGAGRSLIATPIINQPQSAILGVGRVEKRVIVREVDGTDAMLIRPMVYLTVTIDHRVLDGFVANRFLGRVVDVLEAWNG